MAFVRKKGKTAIKWCPVAASTCSTAVKGALMCYSGGYIIPTTNTTAPSAVAGVLLKDIATTDADYATARMVPVEVPIEKGVEWECAVSAGTLAATSVGAFFDLGTDDLGITVAQNGTTYDVVKCTKYISATKGWFELNISTDGIAGK